MSKRTIRLTWRGRWGGRRKVLTRSSGFSALQTKLNFSVPRMENKGLDRTELPAWREGAKLKRLNVVAEQGGGN